MKIKNFGEIFTVVVINVAGAQVKNIPILELKKSVVEAAQKYIAETDKPSKGGA